MGFAVAFPRHISYSDLLGILVLHLVVYYCTHVHRGKTPSYNAGRVVMENSLVLMPAARAIPVCLHPPGFYGRA